MSSRRANTPGSTPGTGGGAAALDPPLDEEFFSSLSASALRSVLTLFASGDADGAIGVLALVLPAEDAHPLVQPTVRISATSAGRAALKLCRANCWKLGDTAYTLAPLRVGRLRGAGFRMDFFWSAGRAAISSIQD